MNVAALPLLLLLPLLGLDAYLWLTTAHEFRTIGLIVHVVAYVAVWKLHRWAFDV